MKRNNTKKKRTEKKKQRNPVTENNKLYQEERPILSWIGTLVIALLPLFMIRFSQMRGFANQSDPVRLGMKVVLSVLLVIALVLFWQKNLSAKNILLLLIIAGVVMRLGYLTYTNWVDHQHDLGGLTEGPNGVGNAGYIFFNTLKGHLPQSNEYQFYQPPLYFFLSAAVIKLMEGAKAATVNPDFLKWAMAVSCAAACLTLVVIQKIMDALKIQRKYQIPAMALAAFLPNWIFMGGRVNNDALVTLFMVLIVYFTVKWYKDRSMKNIIALALSFGFGMMSKISCGTLALFTGPVMLYALYQSWKEKKVLPTVGQFSVFAGISFPLGLWYPIRNFIRFGQSLTFVHRIPDGSPYSSATSPLSERLFSMPLFSEWKQPFAIMRDDVNIWMHMARSAVFGEWSWENAPKIIAVGFFYINFLLMVLAFVAMIYVCVKGFKQDRFVHFSPLALWTIIIVSYISFNLSYPASCTADARYIPIAILAGMISLAQANERLDSLHTSYGKWIPLVGKVFVVLFCVGSVWMYA